MDKLSRLKEQIIEIKAHLNNGKSLSEVLLLLKENRRNGSDEAIFEWGTRTSSKETSYIELTRNHKNKEWKEFLSQKALGTLGVPMYILYIYGNGKVIFQHIERVDSKITKTDIPC